MAPHLLATIADQFHRIQAMLLSLRTEHPEVTQLNSDRSMLLKNLHNVDSIQQEMLRASRDTFLKTLLRLKTAPPQAWASPSLPTTQQPCAMRACAPASPTARALRVCLSEDAFRWLLGNEPPPTSTAERHDLIRELGVAEGVLFDLAAHLVRVDSQLKALLGTLNDALDRHNAGRGCTARIGHLVTAVLHCRHGLQAPDQPLPGSRPASMAA